MIVLYATRFGTTEQLAQTMAAELAALGHECQCKDVDHWQESEDTDQQLVLLTSIIWDRPVPPFRQWMKKVSNQHLEILGLGVVCGAAGIRPNGGMIYAGQVAKRLPNSPRHLFALSGQIPEQQVLKKWEWLALRLFAKLMRRPELFEITPGVEAAKAAAKQIGALLQGIDK